MARTDPSDTHWMLPGKIKKGNAELPPPPKTLEALYDRDDRIKARELWFAAHRLRLVCDHWRSWWNELRTQGDADPAIAHRYRQAAVLAIRTLAGYQVDLPLFRQMSDVELIDRLPPCPDGSVAEPRYGLDESAGEVVCIGQWPAWQKDPIFLMAGFLGRGRGTSFLNELVGYMKGLIQELETSPATVLHPRRRRVVDEATLTAWDERLRIDLVAGTVTLDGTQFKNVDRKLLLILTALLQA